MKFDGFNWDEGNWPKCEKHGLSKAAIEWALEGTITLFNDPHNADKEQRYRAIGKDDEGRYVFMVFCIRELDEKTLLRPISARYMHKKEIEHYERQN